MVSVAVADGHRDGNALGDAEDQRGEDQEVIDHEPPEEVELRPQPGRDAEDHDHNKEEGGHVDRGVLRVPVKSRPHRGQM